MKRRKTASSPQLLDNTAIAPHSKAKPRYTTLVKALTELQLAYDRHLLADADPMWLPILRKPSDKVERLLKRVKTNQKPQRKA